MSIHRRTHLRTRNELIQLLEQAINWVAVSRALLHRNEVLGAFSKIADKVDAFGWIVRAWSPLTNRQFIIAVCPGSKNEFHIQYLGTIPWKYWIGDQQKARIWTGDNPEQYKLLRENERD